MAEGRGRRRSRGRLEENKNARGREAVVERRSALLSIDLSGPFFSLAPSLPRFLLLEALLLLILTLEGEGLGSVRHGCCGGWLLVFCFRG